MAERDGETVGCIGAYQRGHEEAEIRRLAVRRDARRLGVASQLLDHAEAFCRDYGYVRTTAWTYNHMPGAIAFLRRRGYREIEEHAFPHTSSDALPLRSGSVGMSLRAQRGNLRCGKAVATPMPLPRRCAPRNDKPGAYENRSQFDKIGH